ncbi:MAG TPA: hypothetical protein PK954_05445, partial [Anaerolineales bacterium]|nr:hypothetical protein [Anaerolineales bacterium]
MPEVSRLEGVVSIEGAEDAERKLAGVQAGFDGAAASAQKSGPAFSGAGMSVTDFSSAIGLAIDALQLAGQAYEDTIGRAAAWGDEMGDLAQITNSSVSETSRLAATLELMGVKSDSLTRVVKAMNKEGLEFNLQTLLRLNREYNAIQDPVAKTQFIFDKFGESGADMAEILGRDETAILKLAEAADRSGKVIDEAFAEKAETWNAQMEILGKQAEGFGITLGGAAIDGILGFLNAVDDATDGWLEWVRAIPLIGGPMGDMRDAVEGAIDAFDVSTKRVQENRDALDDGSRAVTAYGNRWAAIGASFDPAIEAAKEAEEYFRGVEEAAEKARQAETDAWLSRFELGLDGNPVQQENERYGDQMTDLKGKASELKAEIDKLTASNGAYYETVVGNGMSQAELELSTAKLAAAQEKLAKETDPVKAAQLRVEIERQQEAIAGADKVVGGYVDNSKAIGDLTTEYEEVKKAIEAVEKAHQKATAQIVLDILTQKLMSEDYGDGLETLSEDEKRILETAAKNWDIYEGSTIQVMDAVDKSITEHGMNAAKIVSD